MLIMRRRLACCSRDREAASIDFDEEGVMTYNGLESCILNSQSYDNASGSTGEDGGATYSGDEDASSCSSNHVASGSFSSQCMMMKRNDHGPDDLEFSQSPQHFYWKESDYTTNLTDLEAMKEKFANLLLGEDVTGGKKGVSTALALSNAITNLAVSVFGELWKLEPLPDERKSKWRREMNWLLSPTNYMVELVPAKKFGTNGQTVEIMTAKARSDIHMNLPALEKLDSILIEVLDSMVDTEFWYVEVGSRAEGRSRSAGESKRWWLPSPQVPATGLSDTEKKKLLNQGKRVHQVLKAAKSTNESVLLEMPVPDMIKDALNKTIQSGNTSLGEELYNILAAESIPAGDMINSLKLDTEHGALQAVNKLEAAMFAWKEAIKENSIEESPARSSWPFGKDPVSNTVKVEFLLNRAELLRQQLKTRYPNLPSTFLDVIKIQYGKDVGHSILEAYSRVLGKLAFSILSRIGDILEEDRLNNPNSPVAPNYLPGLSIPVISDSPMQCRVRHSLLDQMNRVDGNPLRCCGNDASYAESPFGGSGISSITATPSRSRVWCIGGDSCGTLSAMSSP